MRYALAVVVLSLVACARAQKPEVVSHPALAPAPIAQLEAQPVNAESVTAADPWAELRTALSANTLLFDFNSDHLKPEGLEALRQVGEVLRKHATLAIRIEGNCDERGTEEYNLMLGQRRAEVAKKYLITLGVGDKQIETMSYGDLRPAVQGSSEDAYAKNRRDELRPRND